MKQRIRVVGLLRREGKVLYLKKAQGRGVETPSWELPTGKINFGEQPEEAMGRMMYESLGVRIRKINLKDVITFTGFSGASQLGNLFIIFEIEMDVGEKIVTQEKYTAYKFLGTEELAGVVLDDATVSVIQIEEGKVINGGGEFYRAVANAATVYVDGASRGNPGPAGIGYYLVDETGEVLKQGGEFIGFATSRVAEYYGLKEGCQQALELGLKKVRFVTDNMMMMQQMRGVYQVKNKDISPIYEEVKRLFGEFEAVAIMQVNREKNQMADREANLAIDRRFQR